MGLSDLFRTLNHMATCLPGVKNKQLKNGVEFTANGRKISVLYTNKKQEESIKTSRSPNNDYVVWCGWKDTDSYSAIKEEVKKGLKLK